MTELHIRLLGPPEIRVNQEPLDVDTRKAVALLAFLAVDRSRHQREALAALLWPEYDRDGARAALRRTLSNLRKALGGVFLVVEKDTIGLDEQSAGVSIDTERFRRLIMRADRHEHDRTSPCPRCERDLSDAATLYRGDFMRGFSLRDSVDFEEWQLYRADEYRRLHAEGLDHLARVLEAAGKEDAAISTATRRLAIDPLHEPAHRLLMNLYASSGRRPEAIRQYRECVAVLDRELGVPPLTETSELYRAIKEDRLPVRSEAEPSPEVKASTETRPLIGRRQELHRLHRAYDNLTDRTELVAIEGEAGVGKTRVVEEFLGRVEAAGGRTLITRCYEDEKSLAYAPIVEALRTAVVRDELILKRLPEQDIAEVARLLPDLIEAPRLSQSNSPAAQSQFISGISRALVEACAGSKPGVLFIDDLQWADTSSLDVLAWLLRRTARGPLLVVGTYRNEDALATQKLRKRAPASSIIRIPRLSQAEVMEMVEAADLRLGSGRSDIGARLYQETEGVPLFIVEYLASLQSKGLDADEWEWPEGIRDLLRERVADAGEVARQILAAAAVVGRSFDFDVVREVSGRSNEESVPAIEELIARGLIVEIMDSSASPTYDFSHQKIRAFIYEETGLARRRLLHSRTADALIRLTLASPSEQWMSLAIANHCRLGGREQDAAIHFARAGDLSRNVFANAEAMSHFKSALALGHPEPSLLHEAVGDLHTLMGEYGEALNSYETAAALRGPAQTATIEHKLGRVHHRRGDWQSAVSHYRSALAQLAHSDSPSINSKVLSDLSLTTYHAGDQGAAQELGAQAVELAEESGDDLARAQANNVLGILAASRNDLDPALHYLEESRALGQTAGDHAAQIAALNNMALTYRAAGQLEPAMELTRESLRLCELQGDRHREAALHNNLADLLQAAGRSDDAMVHLKRAVAIFAEIGEPGKMEPAIWKLVEW